MGLYTKESEDTMYVGNFVVYGKITAEQYQAITDEQYPKATE